MAPTSTTASILPYNQAVATGRTADASNALLAESVQIELRVRVRYARPLSPETNSGTALHMTSMLEIATCYGAVSNRWPN